MNNGFLKFVKNKNLINMSVNLLKPPPNSCPPPRRTITKWGEYSLPPPSMATAIAPLLPFLTCTESGLPCG